MADVYYLWLGSRLVDNNLLMGHHVLTPERGFASIVGFDETTQETATETSPSRPSASR